MTRIDRIIIGAAILVAPIFWGLAYLYLKPAVGPAPFDLAWPFSEPKHFLFLILLIPVVEELCFRGVIQPYLFRKTSERYLYRQVSLANLITSGLFVLLHLLKHSLVWSAATFVPSLLFGWLRERTGQTWPAVAMHIYFNLGYFYLLSGL